MNNNQQVPTHQFMAHSKDQKEKLIPNPVMSMGDVQASLQHVYDSFNNLMGTTQHALPEIATKKPRTRAKKAQNVESQYMSSSSSSSSSSQSPKKRSKNKAKEKEKNRRMNKKIKKRGEQQTKDGEDSDSNDNKHHEKKTKKEKKREKMKKKKSLSRLVDSMNKLTTAVNTFQQTAGQLNQSVMQWSCYNTNCSQMGYNPLSTTYRTPSMLGSILQRLPTTIPSTQFPSAMQPPLGKEMNINPTQPLLSSQTFFNPLDGIGIPQGPTSLPTENFVSINQPRRNVMQFPSHEMFPNQHYSHSTSARCLTNDDNIRNLNDVPKHPNATAQWTLYANDNNTELVQSSPVLASLSTGLTFGEIPTSTKLIETVQNTNNKNTSPSQTLPDAIPSRTQTPQNGNNDSMTTSHISKNIDESTQQKLDVLEKLGYTNKTFNLVLLNQHKGNLQECR